MALRFGAHMPTTGGLHRALSAGVRIGCDTVQIFTASPRQWNSAPPDPAKIRAFRRMTEATGVYPLIAHDSYLINLASGEEALVEKSRRAFLEEMRRAEQLGLDFVVTHMGAHTGAGTETGIRRLAESLNWLQERIPEYRVRVALETTAGQGTTLGASFDEFPQIFALVREPERLAVCLDTCHIFVAGYDIRDEARARAVWDEFDRKVGIRRLVCIHANDAEKGLGSRTDRHAHIGEGKIGFAGFRAFLSDTRLPDGLPVIVETPEAESMHVQNVWRLKNLLSPNSVLPPI
ncbi:MAG: deoxyribonuclease IV [Capsulimonadales bacterium]|nr:deoxyribonuclease IV [Capsulimonadales bacterium]